MNLKPISNGINSVIGKPGFGGIEFVLNFKLVDFNNIELYRPAFNRIIEVYKEQYPKDWEEKLPPIFIGVNGDWDVDGNNTQYSSYSSIGNFPTYISKNLTMEQLNMS